MNTMEKLKKEQIDWAEYRQNLTGSLSNERIWASGYCGEDNPHTGNCNKLEEELKAVDYEDYDLILDLHSDTPGYFDDFLLKPDMGMKDRIRSFGNRADTLRRELIDAITGLLKDNNLKEIQLSRQPDKQPWVVWFDKRNYGYDSRVTKVLLTDKGIALEVYDEDCCRSETLTSEKADSACTNIDWLCRVLDSIHYTLSLPESVGTSTIAGQTVEWSYDERGMTELFENDMEEIEVRLAEGIQKGKLRNYDEYDVEYNGIWKVRNNL